jgi:hypothetical protein
MGESKGKPEGQDHLGDGRIILTWIFRKWELGLDQAGSG